MLRLAKAMGYVNVDAMLAETTAEQITEWTEDYRIDGWPEDRLALQLAMIGGLLIQELRHLTKNPEKVKVSDLLPDFKETEKPRGIKQHNALVSRFLAAGAVIKPRETNG